MPDPERPTTDPSPFPAHRIDQADHSAAARPAGIAPGVHPVGVAPFAVDIATEEAADLSDRRRSRRRPRIIAAAAVTGAMALMPLAGPTAIARERDRHAMRVASAELFLRQKAGEVDAARTAPTAGAATADAAPAGRSRPRSTPAADEDQGDATAGSAVAQQPVEGKAGRGADEQGQQTGGAQPATAPAPADAKGEAEGEAEDRPAVQPPPAKEPTAIASVSGIRLFVPSMETAVVGFHEAAVPGSLEMASVAPLKAKHNPRPMPEITKTQPQQVAPVMVLPTRARSAPPSTAIDIAVPAGEEILSMVDGTVTAVLPYTLYGQHADFRVEIQPQGRPDLRVVMIHMDDIAVEVGDRVRRGETRIAGTAKPFPFESQIDRFAEDLAGRAMPHVHVEVKQVG